MKLIIQTQYKENYGDEQNPHWKFKGGSTYVVEDITGPQALRIERDGIPTLISMLEYYGTGSEEYITDYHVGENSEKVCDDWDTPIMLKYSDKKWSALKFTFNGPDGWMNSKIHAKSEQWDLQPQSERCNYECQYKIDNGWFDHRSEQLKTELAA
jgi:hypothetical protein